MGLKVLFSDIDGTCVHYSDNGRIRLISRQTENGDVWEANSPTNGLSSEVLVLPRSTSGSKGFISKFTLQLFAAVRQLGVKLVLISGCRSTTLLQRLPFLPFADAYVCESGGRIFYLNSDLPTAVKLKEDTAWRARHEAAGPRNQEDLDPRERAGVLWSYYEALVDAHFKVDAQGYSTAIRIRTSADRRDQLPQLPPELTVAENLGSMDIFPATSGKLNAAVYLMNKFGADENGNDSIFMCGKSAA
jgi:hydroxymethylpyrimidine pyrophosphatase-like HAD family hydrolase